MEREPKGNERYTNPEELERHGQERRAELHEQLEARSPEKESAQSAEVIREHAEKLAESSKEKPAEKVASPAEKRKDTPLPRNKSGRDASFKLTMNEARSHMSGPSRTFSKIIHNKAVEKTSEAVGSTVARPNAILAGAVSAFVLTLAIYLIAKYYGYPLSGFESIGAFILGWVLGLLFDYLRVMITGKKA